MQQEQQTQTMQAVSNNETEEKKEILADILYKNMIELHKEYKKEKVKRMKEYINQDGKKPEGDTESIWFEMTPEFKKVLKDYVEDPYVSGIRFYLCSYPYETSGGVQPHKPAYIRQTTIGFVATKLGSGGKQEDYYKDKTEMKTFLVSPAQNNGELCPPLTGCR